MENEIFIQRRNCTRGPWRVPDDETGRQMNAAEMIEHYISEHLGRKVDAYELSKLHMSFEPDDPNEIGGHGVMGMVNIKFELKD